VKPSCGREIMEIIIEPADAHARSMAYKVPEVRIILRFITTDAILKTNEADNAIEKLRMSRKN